ncbi:hypothetical protein AB0L57_29360 [Nocardia sp. NPDC052254]|uniref:hypothetical protein n=1 Tax=Nocardia sp. NPDC052254 TaxID=3155681 RepID=UPI0034405789
MPRKRPGALRALQTIKRPVSGELPRHIRGLSLRTVLAVHRAELLSQDYPLYPGATDAALRRFRKFLEPAGSRPLYPRAARCPCPPCAIDDVRHARDVLHTVLGLLPVRERAELRRLIRPLDSLYRRRTLPNPFADHRHWHHEFWWHRRLLEGTEA